MILCKSLTNKHKNICVGLIGMMLVFLAVSFHRDRRQMCIAKEEADDLLQEKVTFSYFMFFCMSLHISWYGATINCRTLCNAEFNASADFLIIFHDEMNRRIFYTLNSTDRSNSHSSVHFMQYLQFLYQTRHFPLLLILKTLHRYEHHYNLNMRAQLILNDVRIKSLHLFRIV